MYVRMYKNECVEIGLKSACSQPNRLQKHASNDSHRMKWKKKPNIIWTNKEKNDGKVGKREREREQNNLNNAFTSVSLYYDKVHLDYVLRVRDFVRQFPTVLYQY